jgi:hypothetical protein
MALIAVGAGGPDIVGVFPVILSDLEGPKTITAKSGPNAGQDVDVFDWIFAIDDGGQFDGEIVKATSSTASGPKSKMYAYITALLGGRPPAEGQTFEKQDLVGRVALATIGPNEGGWPRIQNLSALPASMQQQMLTQQAPQPQQPQYVPQAQPQPQQPQYAPQPAPAPQQAPQQAVATRKPWQRQTPPQGGPQQGGF